MDENKCQINELLDKIKKLQLHTTPVNRLKNRVIGKRLNICISYLKGNTYSAIAKEFDEAPTNIERWIKIYLKCGITSFDNIPTPYFLKETTDSEKAILEKAIMKISNNYERALTYCTPKILCDFINELLSMEINIKTCSRVLDELRNSLTANNNENNYSNITSVNSTNVNEGTPNNDLVEKWYIYKHCLGKVPATWNNSKLKGSRQNHVITDDDIVESYAYFVIAYKSCEKDPQCISHFFQSRSNNPSLKNFIDHFTRNLSYNKDKTYILHVKKDSNNINTFSSYDFIFDKVRFSVEYINCKSDNPAKEKLLQGLGEYYKKYKIISTEEFRKADKATLEFCKGLKRYLNSKRFLHKSQ